MNGERFYGTDETEELASIAEVTVEEDGSYSVQVVTLDKRDESESEARATP